MKSTIDAQKHRSERADRIRMHSIIARILTATAKRHFDRAGEHIRRARVALGMAAAVVVALIVIPAGNALAEDARTWTEFDTALQLTYTAVTIADWSQTLHIARNPDSHSETNKFLGEHPSTGRVNAWFAGCIALNATVASLLPRPYRNVWQSFWIGYEYSYVERNIKIGLKLSF